MVGREGVSYPNPNTRLKSGREKNNASQPTAPNKHDASSGLACLVSILVGDLGPFLSSSPWPSRHLSGFDSPEEGSS